MPQPLWRSTASPAAAWVRVPTPLTETSSSARQPLWRSAASPAAAWVRVPTPVTETSSLARLSLDGLDRFDDIHHQLFVLGMESAGKKPRRHCRAFTPEFKAEIRSEEHTSELQ